MNSTSWKFHRIALAVLATTAFLSQAEAAPVVSVSPATQNVANGAGGSVDVIVSGLTQAIGGFEFDLTWTAGFLSGASFTANLPFMGAGTAFDFGFGVVGNSANTFVLADAAITEAALAGLQGGSFILGTLAFTGGPSNGLTPLTLSGLRLSEYDGVTTVAGVTSVNGEVCVGGNCAVPEPTTALLVAAALGALALSRRSKQA